MIAPARWADLRRFTPARVAREGAGNGLPTAAHLAFQAAHAAARDAVHAVLDVAALRSELKALGIARVTVRSLAPDRHQYLLRSDLGRQLRPEDRVRLIPISDCFAFVVCGGLSAIAIRRHAATLLAAVGPARRACGLAPAPVVIAEQGRVAPGDDVGQILAAQAVAVLSAEHPGLSAADSLGIYLTWQPRRGRTDAELDCISNVWPDGLSPAAAVDKLLWLISEMRRLRLTGVGVKDAQHGAFAGADTPLHLARWARGEGAVHPLARPPHAGSADPEPCPRAPGG